ncbi:MAG: hypothetical protein H6Q89_4918, partial [Myxococcaceae bacterium]|nr:hypothetical protein [Myxococcaceae bacterium]
TIGYANDYRDAGTGCGFTPMPGPDRAYEMLVQPGQRLTATLSPGAGVDLGVDLIAGPAAQCDALPERICVGGSDEAGGGGVEIAQYLNAGTLAQSIFVLIDSYTTASDGTGSYDLSLSLANPPAGDLCATAATLVPATALTGQVFTDFGNEYTGAGTGCGTPNGGSDRVYSVLVGANQRLTVTVTPTAGLNTSVSIVASAADCATRTCVAQGSGGASGVADQAQYLTGASAQTVLVVVDSDSLGSSGTFSILATVDTPPSTGDVCQTPDLLPTDGGVLSDTTVNYSNNFSGAGNCASASAGPDRVYQLDIPAGLMATVTATPAAGFDTSLSLVASPAATCDVSPRVCVASNNSGGLAVADVARKLNSTTLDETVYVIVDSAALAGGAYTLTASLGPPPAGETCQNAGTAIAATILLTGETTVGYSDNYSTAGPGCGFATMPGADRAYLVTVGPGQRLTATATPAAFDIGIDLVLGPATSCDANPRVCLDGDDDGASGAAETVTYTNSTVAAQSIYVIIDSYSTSGAGTYGLNLVLDTPPTGDICSAPTPILMSGTLLTETTTGFSNNYAPNSANVSCTGDENAGLDRVYSVTLNAGQVLTVTADPIASDDVGVYLIASPATNCTLNPTCLDGSDTGFDDTAEVATYTNATGATQTVFIVIDSFYPTAPVTYSLAVTIL